MRRIYSCTRMHGSLCFCLVCDITCVSWKMRSSSNTWHVKIMYIHVCHKYVLELHMRMHQESTHLCVLIFIRRVDCTLPLASACAHIYMCVCVLRICIYIYTYTHTYTHVKPHPRVLMHPCMPRRRIVTFPFAEITPCRSRTTFPCIQISGSLARYVPCNLFLHVHKRTQMRVYVSRTWGFVVRLMWYKLFVYVCTYACVYTCVYIIFQICGSLADACHGIVMIVILFYACRYLCIYVCVYIYKYIYIYIYIWTLSPMYHAQCLLVCVCVCVCVYFYLCLLHHFYLFVYLRII